MNLSLASLKKGKEMKRDISGENSQMDGHIGSRFYICHLLRGKKKRGERIYKAEGEGVKKQTATQTKAACWMNSPFKSKERDADGERKECLRVMREGLLTVGQYNKG